MRRGSHGFSVRGEAAALLALGRLLCMDLRRGWMTECISAVRMSEEDPARAMAAGHRDKNRGELDRGRGQGGG
jgi:hypothetical protein